MVALGYNQEKKPAISAQIRLAGGSVRRVADQITQLAVNAMDGKRSEGFLCGLAFDGLWRHDAHHESTARSHRRSQCDVTGRVFTSRTLTLTLAVTPGGRDAVTP